MVLSGICSVISPSIDFLFQPDSGVFLRSIAYASNDEQSLLDWSLESRQWRPDMPHIKLPEGLQGIRGPMAFRPETAKPLNELAEALLHAPNSLPQGDRELIATYVSSLNDCYFCQTVHGSIAAACLNNNEDLVFQVKRDFKSANISEKLKSLLAIAGKVQRDGKLVTAEDIANARKHGATDVEIHDTVLIAAAFSMYNRYVDGLDTWQPRDEALYRERGKKTAREGYVVMSREYLPPNAE
jgi:uncharacterized peroxidase-related enzyme